jgi:putative membrane protein
MSIRYRIKGLDLVQTAFFTALGVIVAAHTSSNITYGDGNSLLVSVLVLTAINILLKPFIVFFAFPFILLTFGLGMWVINALLFKWVGGGMVEGFSVMTWGAAFWGAFMISLLKSVGNWMFGGGVQIIRSSRPFDEQYRNRSSRRHINSDNGHIDI